jgi:hypothetical protein
MLGAALTGTVGDLPSETSAPRVVILGGCLIFLHVAFLWGGGGLTSGSSQRPPWRTGIAILVASLLIGFNIFCVYVTFSDWADRFDSPRSDEYRAIFTLQHESFILLPFLVGATVTALSWHVRSLHRRAALSRVLAAVTVSAWLLFSLSAPTQAVAITHLNVRFLAFATPSLFTHFFAYLELIGCAGVFLYLLRPPDTVSRPLKSTECATDGGPYIDSAKTIAAFLLLIAYFGITQAVSHTADLEQIAQARDAFAKDLVRRLLTSDDYFRNWRQGPGSAASTYQMYDWLAEHMPKKASVNIAWAEGITISVVRMSGTMFGEHNRFFEVAVQEGKDSRPWVIRTYLDLALPSEMQPSNLAIAGVAFRNGIKPERNEDYAQLYFRTETDLLRKQVALPNSGLSFPIGQLVWVCFLAAVVMLVILDDRIRNILRDPKLGYGKPWLILDAEQGLGKLISNLWIVLILLGPWLLGVTLVRMTSLGIRANGAVSYLTNDIITYLSLFVLLALSTILSLRVIARILLLRRLQSVMVRSK